MKVYNTLSGKKEEFVPIEEGKVSMYVCGPTVYNLIHIGNARPMIVFDTVRRYMEHRGYDVNYVSNFTDVDDKIIKKANEEGTDPSAISERYIAECKKDMEALHVKPATTHPKATCEIDGMIEMIQTLIDRDTPMWRRTAPFTLRREAFRVTASSPTRIWTICEAAVVPFWCPGRSRSRIRWTLYSGNRRRKASLSGSPRGAREDRAGISSAR